MAKKITITQVADRAGVSIGTVSRVLNDSDKQAPVTVARVRGVMQELGYVPRRNSRRARNGNGTGKNGTKRIGLLFPDTCLACLGTPLAKGLIEGAEKVLAEQNVYLNVLTLNPDGSLPQAIENGELDGLIIRSGVTEQKSCDQFAREIQTAGLPTVWTFGGLLQAPWTDVIMVDNRGCGEWGAAKVLENGCRNVFAVRHNGLRNLDLEYRITAFDFFLSENGIKTEIIAPQSDEEMGERVAEICHSEAVIFVAGHDHTVLNMHNALAARRDAGKTTCHLIAVMTDEIPLQPHVGEDLQVLHIDPQQIGMVAARQLLSRREHPWAPPARMLVSAKELQGRDKGNLNHMGGSEMDAVAPPAEVLLAQ